MLWRSSLLAVGFVAVVAVPLASTTWAQDESREDRFFRFLDRDNDGRIAGEELSRLDDRMKERIREAGLNPDREISRESFVSGMQRRQNDRDSGDRRGSDGDRGRPTGGSTAKPVPKAKVILMLSATYATSDKDGDNQIGMYEWDRAKFAEFLALDRNGDGFLTARELDDPQRPAPSVPSGAVAGSPAAATATTTTVAAVAGSSPVAVPAAPTANDSPEVKRAKYFFSLTDKDKNGVISPEEWAASRGVRVMFEKAGVTATLPLQEATFVEQFQLTQKKPAS